MVSHWWSLQPSSTGVFLTWLKTSLVTSHQSMILWQRQLALHLTVVPYCRNCTWWYSKCPNWSDGSQPKLGCSLQQQQCVRSSCHRRSAWCYKLHQPICYLIERYDYRIAIGLAELFQTGKIIIARNYQSFRVCNLGHPLSFGHHHMLGRLNDWKRLK